MQITLFGSPAIRGPRTAPPPSGSRQKARDGDGHVQRHRRFFRLLPPQVWRRLGGCEPPERHLHKIRRYNGLKSAGLQGKYHLLWTKT